VDSDKVHRSDDHLRERMIRAQRLVSAPREPVERRLSGILMQEFDELPWISHRETTQHQSINNAKNRSSCTNAQTEDDDGDGGEHGRLAEKTQTESNVLHKGFQPRACADRTNLLFNLLHTPEFDARGAPCRCRCHPFLYVLVGLRIEMELNLLVQHLVSLSS